MVLGMTESSLWFHQKVDSDLCFRLQNSQVCEIILHLFFILVVFIISANLSEKLEY